MKNIRLGIIAILALLASTVTAFAATGTIIRDTNGYKEASRSSRVVEVLRSGQTVNVLRCSSDMCQIKYSVLTILWVDANDLSQQAAPQPQPQPVPPPAPWPQPVPPPAPWPQPVPPPAPWPQPQPPRPQPQPPVYQDAGACFFSDTNFRGSSFCVSRGDSYNRLRNWANTIRSVQVFGGARVDLCSDANFYGYCTTMRSNTPRLPNELDRRSLSLEVY